MDGAIALGEFRCRIARSIPYTIIARDVSGNRDLIRYFQPASNILALAVSYYSQFALNLITSTKSMFSSGNIQNRSRPTAQSSAVPLDTVRINPYQCLFQVNGLDYRDIVKTSTNFPEVCGMTMR